ncbi:MAG: hypothetical protein ACRENI_09240 [Gemmatimonadaceae bacterium]
MNRDDDDFDGFIGQHAGDVNRPPALVPREQMWARIQEQRLAQAVAPAWRDEGPVVPIRMVSRRPWPMVAAGLAATLLVGVGIGRLTVGDGTRDATLAPVAAVPPRAVEPVVPAVVARAEPVAGAATIAAVEGEDAHAVYARPRPPAVPPAQQERSSSRGSNTPYQVATARHLMRTEALLASFRADEAGDSPELSAQIADWAGDLLSTTRLLIDSPAGTDVSQRRLLEDLELVLAQIVQISPDHGNADRRLIDRALERGQLLARLRIAVPQGSPAGDI